VSRTLTVAFLAGAVGFAAGSGHGAVEPAIAQPAPPPAIAAKASARLPDWRKDTSASPGAAGTGLQRSVFDARPFGAATLGFQPDAPTGVAPATTREETFSNVQPLDGRSFRAGALVVRLAGIDLPDAGEECRTLDGRLESCRTRAATQLDLLTRWRSLTCRYTLRGVEALATCRMGDADLADRLVRTGYLRRAAPDAGQGRV
jgi:endonuclease YncB( thermonuclease family)